MRCTALTHTLQPGEQTMLEIVVENPQVAFHVRHAAAVPLGSTFEIEQILFDNECQLSHWPIEADTLAELSLDSCQRPRSIVFFIRNSGSRPGHLAVALSDGIEAADSGLDRDIVH